MVVLESVIKSNPMGRWYIELFDTMKEEGEAEERIVCLDIYEYAQKIEMMGKEYGGEVVLAKNVSGKEIIGKVPNLSYDAIIGGIKKAAQDALDDVKEDLSKHFKIRGYIMQTRTSPDKSERYALINVGSKFGVKPGQKFFVYTFESVEDPLTNKVECDIIKLPVKLEVSNQIQANKSWTVITGDKKQIMRVKVGQIVERAPVK